MDTGVERKYILPKNDEEPNVGDSMTNRTLFTTYDYDGKIGLGRAVTITSSSGTNDVRVVEFMKDASVVLVHAQVYDQFGFSSKTCVPGDTAVNTRLMTAIDKYLVVRYLEAIGLADEDAVNTGRLWSAYTLMPKSSDFDMDGIPDGWELYVMFGTNTCAGATNFTMDTLKISPWKYDDARALSPSGLNLLDEYDRGMIPTDPWQTDSDGDGILDTFAYQYHLKGDEVLADSDGDGLSNYAEYLLTEAFALTDPVTGNPVVFDPDDAYSIDPNRRDTDYFYKGVFGELYAGEIFSDHDLVEDRLEDLWGLKYSSRYQWDADKDKDEDRWSLYSEARYNRYTGTILAPRVSHYVDETEMRDAPKPTLFLGLRYNGTQKVAGAPVVVKTYTAHASDFIKEDLDATFSTTPGEKEEHTAYIGEWSRRTVRGVLAPGYVVTESGEDTNPFVIEYALYSRADFYTVHITGLMDLDSQLGAKYPDDEYTLDYVTYIALVEKFGTDTIQLISNTTGWKQFEGAVSLTHDGNLEKGYITLFGERVGAVNLLTGEYSLDLEPFGKYKVDRVDETDGGSMQTSLEQARFRIRYKTLVPTMQDQNLKLYLNTPASGYVREGINTLEVFYDLDSDGEYTPGEPMAVANNVNVGWYGAVADMELTDTSPIFTRLVLSSTDNDREKIWSVNNENERVEGSTGSPNGSRFDRLRIIRREFNLVWTNNLGEATDTANYTFDYPEEELKYALVDKWIDFNGKRDRLTEKDILSSGTFDIDWDGLYDEIRTNSIIATFVQNNRNPPNKCGLDLQRAKYAIYIGDTNATIYPIITVRKFDDGALRQVPVPVSPGVDNQIVYTPWPEFKWNMNYRDTYTAFQVEILSTSSNSIWKSGIRRAPPRDADGNYRFRPDLFIGDGYANESNYLWRVSMYNSKFKEDLWSEPVNFRLNVVDSGYTYGKIPVSVRYFGPKDALSNGVIKVEAHRNPDFTDVPEARYVVTNTADIQSFGSEHAANVVLRGLEKGEYFICAWVDLTNDYGTVNWRDPCESWGYAAAREADPENAFSPVAVKLDTADGQSGTVCVYIEDTDTNQNNIPDIYEIIVNGGTLDGGATNVDWTVDGDIAISTKITGNLKALGGNAKEADNGLQATLATTMKKKSFAALSLGVSPDSLSVSPDGSIAVEKTVEGVEISDIGFDAEGNIVIAVEASLSSPSADSTFYTVTVKPTVSVTCKVYRKTSLAEADWTLVSETPVVVGAEPVAVSAKASGDGMSGFYKVVIE